MRNTKQYCSKIEGVIKRAIHSLEYIPLRDNISGILAGSLSGVYFFNESSIESNKFDDCSLIISGFCSSVSYCNETKKCLSTFRSTMHQKACHRVCVNFTNLQTV